MTTELVHIPVPGAPDLLGAEFDGKTWAALKPMCETLGISFPAQLRKLRSRSWAGVAQRATPSAGGVQMATVIDSETIPMWLATIDENRVSEEARPALIALQREAKKALDAYFNQRTFAPAMNQLDVLRAALDQIEAAQRDAAEARAIAERSEARLDGIEGRHDWFSALGYARMKGLPTYNKFVARLGKHAAMIARSHAIEPEHAQHAHYGYVNSFPLWIWELASEGLSS